MVRDVGWIEEDSVGKRERCVFWLVVGKDGDVRKRKKKRKKENPHDLARRQQHLYNVHSGHEQRKHCDVPFLVDVCTHALLVKQRDTCSRKEKNTNARMARMVHKATFLFGCSLACRPLFNYFLLFPFLFSFSLDPFTLLLKPSSCSRIFDFEACGNPWGGNV